MSSKMVPLLAAVSLLLVPLFGQSPGKGKNHGSAPPQLPAAASDGDYYDNGAPLANKVALGRSLFFDKLLSGNLNTSCATCHHPLTNTSDGLSLPVGEGGRGLGVTRDTGSGLDAILERVPRNSPHLFNLGATEFTTMFHDGRVAVDPNQPSGFRSPAGNALPLGLENPLAVQAMFPVTSMTEMAGQPGENPVADAAAAGILAGPGGVWDQLATRLKGQPSYVTAFIDVYSDVNTAADITFVHAANAIAAYEAAAYRADQSPFDRYLRGDQHALSKDAKEGMKLFYGQAGCASCHSGTFQTDHDFHAIAMPQIGPGKGDGSGHEDFGRGRETGLGADMFKFRTPSLRNVALTGPWGHAGAYDSLEAVVRHHLDPVPSCLNYDPSQVVLPSRSDLDAIDLLVVNDPAAIGAITSACELAPTQLSNEKVEYLLAFLHALTDPRSLDLRSATPKSALSGLPLAE